MNHFRPHISIPSFEGYYSKFTLPSKSTLILIICSVPKAETRPHMVSLTYIPHDFPDSPHFQHEAFVEKIDMVDRHAHDPTRNDIAERRVEFEINVPGMGEMIVYDDDSVDFEISDADGAFEFSASVAGGDVNRTPWVKKTPDLTPEGLLVNLPLPLHWHVHSLASRCKSVSLNVPRDRYAHIDVRDTSYHDHDTGQHSTEGSKTSALGACYVHLEKNWAHSFPTSHIWIQAFNPATKSALCVAGGSILKTQAYLVTYQHQPGSSAKRESAEDYSVSFTPPYAMTPPFLSSLSPSLSAVIDWESRTIKLTVLSLTRKIVIEVTAPKGSFVGISAPFEDGHRLNFLGQSAKGDVTVRVYWASRGGLGHWEEKVVERFDGAGVEFGGDVYGMAGREERGN